MHPPFPIRAARPDEYDAIARVLEHAFAGAPEPDEIHAVERELLELDRTLVAVDGDQLVGSATAYTFSMTVPGGAKAATAGVSWVSVLPTHRRRGILAGLMRRQLDDVRGAGRESVAALWASEPAIYGRFGYGLASSLVDLEIPRGDGRLRDVPGDQSFTVRLADTDKSVDSVAAIYDHAADRRPGMIGLDTDVWRRARVLDPESRREGASPLRTLLVEDEAGALRAYARYSTKQAWNRSGPDGSVRVRELEALDPAAAAAAWRYLLDLDLVTTVRAGNRPTDDPLLALLVDPRRAKPELGDGLYLRLVDVGKALSERTYSAPVDTVIEVVDAFCSWNTGRWQLRADGESVSCERTDQDPDLGLGVRELGACYLGGTTLHSLADAGLVVEYTPGAVRTLSTAMRTEPAPWCPFVF